jgi:hypothetical protein
MSRRHAIVPEVMIRCPGTGDEVPTGFSAVSADKLKRIPFGPLVFKCRSCRELHVWSKQEAFLR